MKTNNIEKKMPYLLVDTCSNAQNANLFLFVWRGLISNVPLIGLISW